MKLTIRYYLICVCLWHATSTKAEGFYLADSLFKAGSYRFAALEYERIGYLTEDPAVFTEALLRKSECQKQLNDFKGGELTLSRLRYGTVPDSMMFRCRYSTALISYLSGNFTGAESALLQLFRFTPDSNKTKAALPLFVLVLNEQRRWMEAKTTLLSAIHLSEYSAAIKDSLRQLTEIMYHKKQVPKLKNLDRAQLLSMLLPGAGHWYAGYFWEGLASFTLNAAALAFIGYNIYTRYYITTITSATAIFQMFYAGGLNRVEFLVNKRNYQRAVWFNNKVKAQLFQMTLF